MTTTRLGEKGNSFQTFDLQHSVYSLRYHLLDPLKRKSDEHQISPCEINAFQNRVVVTMKDRMKLLDI